jgi:hypothetical protein
LTPKTVLPTLFIISIIFGPIGGLLIWGSSLVSEITIDYTDCEKLPSASQNGTYNFATIPDDKFSYHMRSKDSKASLQSKPKYAFLDNTNNATVLDVTMKKQCILQFSIPAELEHSVFFYYKLSNFFQNHRRYVKSLNSDQLKGKPVKGKSMDDSDCKPLASINGKPIYPCGLIANSLFNDTYTSPRLLNPVENAPQTYEFSSEGIAWPGEASKYVASPLKADLNKKGFGYDSYDDIVPPPNWALRYPSYNSSNPPPDLSKDQHFQNWMRTAGLPVFTKLHGRNDKDNMLKGDYEIIIGLNFPVLPYKGSKAIVISTVSWIGGKNPFLGWAYVATAGLFVILAVAGTARHLIKPRYVKWLLSLHHAHDPRSRRLGDMSLLSWNR